jgi:hypothetical protein
VLKAGLNAPAAIATRVSLICGSAGRLSDPVILEREPDGFVSGQSQRARSVGAVCAEAAAANPAMKKGKNIWRMMSPDGKAGPPVMSSTAAVIACEGATTG